MRSCAHCCLITLACNCKAKGLFMWKTYFWGEKGLGIYVLIGLIKTAPIMSFSMIEIFLIWLINISILILLRKQKRVNVLLIDLPTVKMLNFANLCKSSALRCFAEPECLEASRMVFNIAKYYEKLSIRSYLGRNIKNI